MSLSTVVLLGSLTLGGVPDSVNWDFSVTTVGENIYWQGSTPIANDGEYYEMLYTVNSATVYVSYAGFVFGPYDVTDMIPPDVIVTWQPSAGPAPLDFGWYEVVTPEDQDPPSLAYDWIVEIDSDGMVSWRGENAYLGQAEYDLGWPWGTVTVQVEEGTINANLEIYKVENPCYEDIDGSGTVDVSDLLILIGNWGTCGECVDEIPGDVTYDDIVDVTDLLMVVGAWGSCPE